MKKNSKVKKLLVGLALSATVAFGVAGCGTTTEPVTPDVPDVPDTPVITDVMTNEERGKLSEMQADLLQDLGYDTGYTILSLDGFESNENVDNGWTAFTTARKSGDKKAQPVSIVFEATAKEEKYVNNVTSAIESCHLDLGFDTAYAVYDSMFTLIDYSYQFSYGTAPETKVLFDNGTTSEQKNAYFNIARTFCDEKSIENDEYNQIMSKFYNQKGKLGDIEYVISRNEDGSFTANVQQYAVTDDIKNVFASTLTIQSDALSQTMAVTALKEYIDNKGVTTSISVQDKAGNNHTVEVTLNDVKFASSALEDISKTVLDNIQNEVAKYQVETINNL